MSCMSTTERSPSAGPCVHVMTCDPAAGPTSLTIPTLMPLADSVEVQRTECWPKPALRAAATSCAAVTADAVALQTATAVASPATEMRTRPLLKLHSQHLAKAQV